MSRREKRKDPAPAVTAEPRAPWTIYAAIVAVALLSSITGIANGFAQDDAAIIAQDSRLHDLSLWRDVFSQPYWPPPYVTDLYRPLASLLLAVQYAMGSGAPMAFRIVSYLLYAASAVAVFHLARRLMPRGIAVGIALLFAAHPVHVEAVALAVAQNELLVTTIVAASVGLYLVRRRASGGALATRDWALLSAAGAVAALSKEQGFLLPTFLVIAELCLVERDSLRTRFGEVGWGFFALAGVALAVLMIRYRVLGQQTVSVAPAEALIGKTFLGRLVTMWRIAPDWLRLLVWPAHLRFDYSPQEFVGAKRIGVHEILGLLLLLSVIAAAVVARRRAPVVTFGLSWLGLALLPVSNVFVATGILIGERTLFLPSVGWLIALGGAVAFYLESRPALAGRAGRGLAVATGILVCLGIARSAMRHPVWHDNNSLTLAAMAESPSSWRAHANYAELMYDRGNAAVGRAEFERAIQLAPSPWWVRNAFARRLRAVGNDSGAVEQLRNSLTQYPDQVDAVSELVAALIATGSYKEALGIANNIIVTENAPPIMMALHQVADSALAAHAPPGSVRVTVPTRRQQ
ncbi:MAG TPA: glycosyltransferase family 39 protein [Gemmatimonadaceae bacterium]